MLFRLFFLSLSLVTLWGCHPRTAPEEGIPLPRKKITPLIAIDAGHGGEDGGTQSTFLPNTVEKDLNLYTAKHLKDLLEKRGFRTLLTRGTDIFVPLPVRTALANGNKASLFVSLHYNAAPTDSAEGVEVYIYRKENHTLRQKQSQALADLVLGQIVKNTKANSRGVKHGDFAVIRDTLMPAILIEGGFLTHKGEFSNLCNPRYLELIAKSVAEAIDLYMDTL